MTRLRVGFVTGIESVWRHRAVAANQHWQRLLRTGAPDVYSLPRFLDASCTFIRNGQAFSGTDFDLVFSELNGSEAQLAYLDALIAAQPPAVAVIPGPPEILASRLTDRTRPLVQRIVRKARFVLAYAPEVATFYDDLAGTRRAVVIPWPFDHAAVRRLATPRAAGRTIRIVLGAPLRFHGETQNHPFVLKSALLDVLGALPPDRRARLSFHTFVYADEDRNTFHRSGYAHGLNLALEPTRRFRAFVRFVSGCDAVVNLTSSAVLGRITFIAAALGRPGLFSPSAALNRALYPHAVVTSQQPAPLRAALDELVRGLLEGRATDRFHPDDATARSTGDFDSHARQFAAIIAGR